jgi:hypothetical protein
MRNISDKFLVKIKTHVLYSVPFPPQNHAGYEILYMVEADRSRLGILHMCSASWVPNAADTPREYVIIFLFSTGTIVKF